MICVDRAPGAYEGLRGLVRAAWSLVQVWGTMSMP